MTPIWLLNMEALLQAGDEATEDLAVLNFFARNGLDWIDRTHFADNAEARAALRRALGWYFRFADFRALTYDLAAKTFVVRGTRLLCSLGEPDVWEAAA